MNVIKNILLTTILICTAFANSKKPNFIVIFTDDQGYGDLSCFGGTHISTPRIDQMAAEGAKLTSFYVAAPICTPSRAALMTGCYPRRVNMELGSHFPVLLASDPKGLNPDEITIAELLKSAGYKTGIFGKWHLGDQPEFLPTRQGFDEFYGLPYSHDIHPMHPNQKKFNFPGLPLLDGEKVVEMDPDADFLTQVFTEKAVDFIERNKEEPFFLYVPHPLPHVPLHVAPTFMKDVPEKTLEALKKEKHIDYDLREALFEQSIAEIDWSVGKILDTLKAQGIDDNTFVIFTSDNGPGRFGLPVFKPQEHSGPLKGLKGTTFEGGMRVPTVVRWPSVIPAGQEIDSLMTTMDLLPTFASIVGAPLPSDRVIDGKNILPCLTKQASTPHEAFFYSFGKELRAVRAGKWKYETKKMTAPQSDPLQGTLYNLETDIAESKNVIKQFPEIAKKLANLAIQHDLDMNQNNRPAAFVKNASPLSLRK